MLTSGGPLEILLALAPIFLIVCVGYVTVRVGKVSRDGVRAMTGFLGNVAVPALLFGAISTRNLHEIVEPGFLLAYGLGSLAAFLFAFAVTLLVLREDLTNAAMFGMGSSISNSLVVGFPVASIVLGPVVVGPFAMVLLIENLLMLPIALILADLGQDRQGGLGRAVLRVVPTLFRNPIVLSILLGVLVSELRLTPPTFIGETIDYLGRTVTGIGLFIVGGMLVSFQYSGNMRRVSLVVMAKLLLHPAAVLVALLLIVGTAIAPEVALAGVIFAAAPTFGIYAVIAERYGRGPLAAAALAPGTVLSFVTLSLLIVASSLLLAG